MPTPQLCDKQVNKMKTWASDLPMWGESDRKPWRMIQVTGEKLWLNHQVPMDIYLCILILKKVGAHINTLWDISLH